MNEGTDKLLAKAEGAKAAAQAALAGGAVDIAAGRAYYAMLYGAKALLNERGLRLRTHAKVCAAFAKHFTTDGTMDAKYHRWMVEASEKRAQCDRDCVSYDEAEQLVEHALIFVEAVARHVRRTC